VTARPYSKRSSFSQSVSIHDYYIDDYAEWHYAECCYAKSHGDVIRFEFRLEATPGRKIAVSNAKYLPLFPSF